MQEYAIVIGATSGIGKALSVAMTKANYKVIGVGRNNDALLALQKTLPANMFIPVVADLENLERVKEDVSSLFSDPINLRYLIHCAAQIEPVDRVANFDYAKWSKNFSVNLFAPLVFINLFKRSFKPSTRVLLLGSGHTDLNKTNPGFGAYATTKIAQRMLRAHLRTESSKEFLTGYLNPGPTDTRLYANFWAEKRRMDQAARPAVQPSTAREIAQFIMSVLENTSDELFTTTDWDYRNADDRLRVQQDDVHLPLAKL
jgi:NADP-dependent 3-hydroxy acid dehydrogenase YdfG